MPERAEALQDEIEVAKKVLNAPFQPMKVNYQETELKKETIQQEQAKKNISGFSL